ncbi:MAG: tyrosine-type recombinase/integrase, partial [Chloroflexota bacterium]|nr:tyrosine-type recombinase/integrase [Chloroflexota bacterium]
RAVHQSGDIRDIAMIEMLIGTGLRVSELLALQVGDLEINTRSGQVTVRKGKRGNQRVVPLKSEVRKALDAYLELHPRVDNTDARLWLGQRGPLKDRSAVLRILNKYSLIAQINDFGPHVLRHTFATRYLDANPDDLRGLAALLGHTNLNTVMIYTEPSFDDLAERVERVR